MGAAVRQGLVTLLVGGVACAPKHAAPPALEPPQQVVVVQRRAAGALTQAQRDSLLRDVQRHRAAWRAREIKSYRLQVAVGCFCPWPDTPAIITVENGVVVALRDTAGKSMGQPREPWSVNTVEGLFDGLERSVPYSDVVEVAFDPRYDYPAYIRSDMKLGLPDDWYWVKASRLTPVP